MIHHEQQKLLSVVVPNYNHAHYLSQSLDSIFSQTLLPAEILIIDDCSTDDSVSIIKEYQSTHKNIRLICNHSQQGVIFGLNLGLKEAISKYVMFLSADDWLLPDFISNSIGLLNQYPKAGFCSSLSFCKNEMKSTSSLEISPLLTPLSKPGFIPAVNAARQLINRQYYCSA